MTQEKASWQHTQIQGRSSLQDAIRNLDATGLQIALVVDQDGQLLGTVTDGDVRRALLRGSDMETPVESVMFLSPLVVTAEMGREMVLHLMRANRIHQLPIIDDRRRVIGLHVWDEVITPARRENTMVIMAGGLGTRLRPFTENCPKPMLPVSGRPMLEHIITRAKLEGFQRFVLSLHYLGHVIENHFGNGEKWDVRIEYIKEKAPLGTAGALSLMQPEPEFPFVVTNGDVLTDIRYGELLDFHVEQHADGTMAVRRHEWQHPFGVVRTKGSRIIGFEEKPIHRSHVNAGIYVLSPSALGVLERGSVCDMPTLFKRLQDGGREIIAYPMHEPWLDVGRPEDLKLANGEAY